MWVATQDLPRSAAHPFYTRLNQILDAMPDVGQGVAGQARDDASKTKARLAVIAYTGLPRSLLKRLRPEDVDWQSGTTNGAAHVRGSRVLGPVQQQQPVEVVPAGLHGPASDGCPSL